MSLKTGTEVVVGRCSRNDGHCGCEYSYEGRIGIVSARQPSTGGGYTYKVLLEDGVVWLHEEALDQSGGFEYAIWIE